MKLPDFSQDTGLLNLRKQMAASRPGHFVLFDASKHLTGQERSRLENTGVKTSLEALRILPDQTLAIKNGRVVVYLADEISTPRHKAHFHVAACSVLEEKKRDALIATTCLTSPFPVPDQQRRRSLTVCPECLSLLAFKGFSLTRNRRIRYSEQLLKNFQLTDFFRVYTLYPVRIEGRM